MAYCGKCGQDHSGKCNEYRRRAHSLVLVTELYDSLSHGEGTEEWLDTPNRMLDGFSPREMIALGEEETNRVLDYVEEIAWAG